MKSLFLWIILWLAVEPIANADEFHPLFRSARAQAMGNAFTAVADDESAIFYNPAALAGNRDFGFKMAAANIDISNDLISTYSNFATIFGSFDVSSLNNFVGKNYYARAEAYTSVTGPNFGIAAIYDVQMGIRIKNTSLPQGTLGAQRTYGAQFAFGIPLVRTRKKLWDLRFGMAGKVLWRAGGYSGLTLTQMLTLDVSQLTSRLQNYGIGFGLDMGFQGIYNVSPLVTLFAGLSSTDIGDTSFTLGNDPQKSNFTAGLGLKYKAGDVKALLSYDYAHLFENWDWKKKSHLGLELGFSLFKLEAGLNQTYISYGAGLSLAIINLMYVHYVEEQSGILGLDPEGRTMAYLAVKFDL
ncbi:MAG: hypothetical protein ABIQ95_06620 [Bdellovibrionia bacterium]